MPEVPLPKDTTAANRAWWDGVAAVHRSASAGFYDPAPVIAGESSLREDEEAALALAFPDGVAGRQVLHLQCHLALDAITFARRGAVVTGVDFSPVALAGARALADRCEVALELVESDATRLPAELHDRFDLVWATVGVLGWHADLGAWMRSAAGALKPGGRLVIYELHPLYCMPATASPLVLDFPYAFDRPHAYDEPGSYADASAVLATTVSVNSAHSLGEVVTSAVAAGLRVDHLREHLSCAFDPRASILRREADGLFRWRLPGPDGTEGPPLPVMFTLVASSGTPTWPSPRAPGPAGGPRSPRTASPSRGSPGRRG